MIIDATTGSIARFVNHSCSPNCRMEKWIVHGQPRMALFAGKNPIMTGDELTYDYNFDPFSAKNVQKCLCGSVNCRGVLGPKVTALPKGEAQPRGAKGSSIKEAVKFATRAGKRKLQAILDGEGDDAGTSNKKRKLAKATGVKRSLSAKAAAAVKKTASSISSNAKAALASATRAPAKSVSVRKSELKKTSKTLTKNGKKLVLAASLTSSATTVVARPRRGRPPKSATKTTTSAKTSVAKTSVAKAGKRGIKAMKRGAAGKGGIRSTINSSKHTISKSTGNKPTRKRGRPRQIAKKSILEDIEEDDTDRALTVVPEPNSADSPRKALEVSKTENKIRVVTDFE